MKRILPLSLVLICLVPLAALCAAEKKAKVKPLPIKVERAFPNLRLKLPIVLTHAGDGSDRVFIASQIGKIHVIPNDQQVKEAPVFLDISSQVVYKEKENEEGLLGLAFHPKYKQNGQFFIYYTTTDAPHTSVLSRFRVSNDDPNQADPDFEEELLRIEQPFWNHNGGGLAFGPDGMLYVALGDGGKANDPLGAGQDLSTLLGSILRIDVDHKDQGKNYAVPKDNPFVGRDGARAEIWAYGMRNIWGMSFDRKTGTLWAGDVGQNLWEEVDIIVRGGNYGWNTREGYGCFEPRTGCAETGFIDPVATYIHVDGCAVIGGYVYRGIRVPSLEGAYIYGDYCSGRIWAIRNADGSKQRAKLLMDTRLFIGSFGQGMDSEVYVLGYGSETDSEDKRQILRFVLE